jgi:hypothetical protein
MYTKDNVTFEDLFRDSKCSKVQNISVRNGIVMGVICLTVSLISMFWFHR